MEKEGINDTQLHVFNHGSVSTDDSGVYTIDFSFYGEPLEKIYVEILTEQENFQQADTSFAFTFTNASNNRDFTVDFALSAIPPEQEKNSTIKGIVRDRYSSELISDCKLLFTMKKKLNGDPRLFVFNEDSIITDSNGSYSVDFTYKESFEKIYVEIRSYKEDYLQGDALIFFSYADYPDDHEFSIDLDLVRPFAVLEDAKELTVGNEFHYHTIDNTGGGVSGFRIERVVRDTLFGGLTSVQIDWKTFDLNMVPNDSGSYFERSEERKVFNGFTGGLKYDLDWAVGTRNIIFKGDTTLFGETVDRMVTLSTHISPFGSFTTYVEYIQHFGVFIHSEYNIIHSRHLVDRRDMVGCTIQGKVFGNLLSY